MYSKTLRPRSVTAPTPVALKSPQFYLQIIKRILPAWGAKLNDVPLKGASLWCALAASAVAIGNACRIGEILAIACGDLLPNGNALVQSEKGGSVRMIWAGLSPDESDQFQRLPKAAPLFPVKYIDCWRAVKLMQLDETIPGHEHKSVTHTGRYAVARKAAERVGAERAGEALGHKSKRAVTYYLDPSMAQKERQARKRAQAIKFLQLQGPQLPDFLFEGV